MVNEGAKILDEGMAQRASDIDVVWIYGYGWPVYRGGPMFWANTVGLDKVVAGLEKNGFAVAAAAEAQGRGGREVLMATIAPRRRPQPSTDTRRDRDRRGDPLAARPPPRCSNAKRRSRGSRRATGAINAVVVRDFDRARHQAREMPTSGSRRASARRCSACR